MKKTKFKLTPINLSFIVLISSFMAWIVYAASASTATIKITSEKSSVTQGSTFRVNISEVTETPVIAVRAKITYDATKLKFKAVEFNGSVFTENMPDENVQGTGYVVVSRYKAGPPYPTGDNFVASITFEPIASGGSTLIKVASSPDSGIWDLQSNDSILSSTGSTSVNLVSPVVPPSNPPPTPPTPPTANPTSPTKTTPTQTPTTTQTPAPTRQTPTQTPTQTPITNNSTDTTAPITYDDNNPVIAQPLTPGTSEVASSQTLMQRLLAILRRLLPALIVGAVVGGGLWFILKKIHDRPFGFGGVVASSNGVGSVKPMGPPANPPVDNSQLIANPKSTTITVKSDPNDNTPRTFSGV